jgi:protein arginine kinase activator
MICQECEQRQATLHFTKIVNGEKTEFHICEVCAKEKGETVQGMSNTFSIHNLLSGLLNFENHTLGPKQQQTQLACNSCGLTYSQFSRSGRFGCASCYTQFGDRLDPLFRKVHSGNESHRGKIPRRSGGIIHMKRELNTMKDKLQQAIAKEEFEEAAQIRDQIRQLERQLNE